MPLIYTTGSYIIATDAASGLDRPYPRKGCRYDESASGFELIFDFHNNPPVISILFTDIATWTDQYAVAYTTASLRTFLQDNTSIGEADTSGKEDKINKVSDFSTVNDVLYPNTQAVVNLISGLSALFFYKIVSVIDPTYYTMTNTASIGGLQTIVKAGVINGQKLATFITNTGSPNITFLPTGVVRVNVHLDKSVGSKDTQIYAVISKRILSGTETPICTTGYSQLIPLGGAPADFLIDGSISSGVILLASDLILVDIYAYCPGGGSAPTITIGIEDNTAARLELPISNIDLSGYERTINKQDSLLPDGTGVLYPTVDSINTISGSAYLYLYNNFT